MADFSPLPITQEQLASLKASGSVEIAPVEGRDFGTVHSVVCGSDAIGVWVWPVPRSDIDKTIVSWLVERYDGNRVKSLAETP